jgi:hypothetical protein
MATDGAVFGGRSKKAVKRWGLALDAPSKQTVSPWARRKKNHSPLLIGIKAFEGLQLACYMYYHNVTRIGADASQQ